jgi:hypothetical protein
MEVSFSNGDNDYANRHTVKQWLPRSRDMPPTRQMYSSLWVLEMLRQPGSSQVGSLFPVETSAVCSGQPHTYGRTPLEALGAPHAPVIPYKAGSTYWNSGLWVHCCWWRQIAHTRFCLLISCSPKSHLVCKSNSVNIHELNNPSSFIFFFNHKSMIWSGEMWRDFYFFFLVVGLELRASR